LKLSAEHTNRTWRVMSLLIALSVILWCAHPAQSDQPASNSSQTSTSSSNDSDYPGPKGHLHSDETGVKDDNSMQAQRPTLQVSFPDGSEPTEITRPSSLLPPATPEHIGFLRRWLKNQQASGKLQSLDELRKRPLLYWRYFAERPPHPARMFFILLLFNFVIGLTLKKRVGVAADCVRKSFWKSIGVGLFCVLLMTTTTRACHDTELLSPLAGLIMGALQFFCICGLVICSRVIGESLLRRLKLAQPKNGEEPSRWQYCTWLLTGTVLVALIAALPPLGLSHHMVLPRLGTRIAMWLSLLGFGAMVRTKFGQKQLP